MGILNKIKSLFGFTSEEEIIKLYLSSEQLTKRWFEDSTNLDKIKMISGAHTIPFSKEAMSIIYDKERSLDLYEISCLWKEYVEYGMMHFELSLDKELDIKNGESFYWQGTTVTRLSDGNYLAHFSIDYPILRKMARLRRRAVLKFLKERKIA